MTFVLSFSIFGVLTAILLGILFLSSDKGNNISNRLLGICFLFLTVRPGKLSAQEYAPIFVLDIYFNLMQSAFLAIGPVIWFYNYTYLSSKFCDNGKKFIHFLPALIALIGAFHIRQLIGEFTWIFIYWGIQIHPLLYVFGSPRSVMQSEHSKNLTGNQRVWLYSILAAVFCIVLMNVLYFTLNFPFYMLTALLIMITVYLICFLAFNKKSNVLVGISDQKYKNLNLDSQENIRIQQKIEKLLINEKVYLDDQLKLSDVSDKLNIPAHIISSVVSGINGKTFPQYVNYLRIKRAKKQLIVEDDKKVIAIAFESGFRSLSAFNRVFTRRLFRLRQRLRSSGDALSIT